MCREGASLHIFLWSVRGEEYPLAVNLHRDTLIGAGVEGSLPVEIGLAVLVGQAVGVGGGAQNGALLHLAGDGLAGGPVELPVNPDGRANIAAGALGIVSDAGVGILLGLTACGAAAAAICKVLKVLLLKVII